MSSIFDFLLRYGYLLLFGWVLAEQLGLPLPSAPLLLAAGALAGTGRMNLMVVLSLPLAAVAICDTIWYSLGRLRGMPVLQMLCRIALEPDSCVRRTQINFDHKGPWALVFAKFVPGLNAMAPPLAGVSRMAWRKFILFDALGGLLWAGAYIGTGYIFSGEIESIAAHLRFLGGGLSLLMIAALGGYIGWKYFNRRRFLRKLRVARISPEELKRRMDANEDLVIVDLRHALEFAAEPETIPGAVQMDAADLEEAVDVIPRDREIVLFCNCPNEATAAQLALRLRSMGIVRIRPLAGGLDGWRNRGYPLQPLGDVLRDGERALPQPATARGIPSV